MNDELETGRGGEINDAQASIAWLAETLFNALAQVGGDGIALIGRPTSETYEDTLIDGSFDLRRVAAVIRASILGQDR